MTTNKKGPQSPDKKTAKPVPAKSFPGHFTAHRLYEPLPSAQPQEDTSGKK